MSGLGFKDMLCWLGLIRLTFVWFAVPGSRWVPWTHDVTARVELVISDVRAFRWEA